MPRTAALLRGTSFVGLSNGAPPGSVRREQVLRVLGPVVRRWCSVAAVDTADRLVGLSFDDGPDPRWTPAVLEVLRAHGVTATFFLLVAHAEAHPEITRAVIAAGHEIGLHGIDHTRLPSLSKLAARRTISEGKQRLEQVVERPVHLFRPAYGAQRVNEVVAARALGMQTVIWSAWAEDWRDQPPVEVADRAAAACHPGAILLLHDGHAPDDLDPAPAPTFDRAHALRLLLQRLHEHSLSVTDVGTLLEGRRPVLVPWVVR